MGLDVPRTVINLAMRFTYKAVYSYTSISSVGLFKGVVGMGCKGQVFLDFMSNGRVYGV